MNPCFRFRPGRAGAALALLAAVLFAPVALAEPVTYQFTGQVTTLGGPLDLSGLFSLGQAVTLDVTVERATAGVPQDAFVTAYTDAVTQVAFTVGSWSGGGAPASSNTTVTNDAPSGATHYDQFSWNALGLTAPPLGTVMFQTLTSTFDDVDGTVFDSGVLPRTFPALGVFEGKTATFLVIDFGTFQSGYVMATLDGVSTPAPVATWGGVKALYRK